MLQQYNPKNENIFIFVKDKLYPRNEAKISVFDSSVQGGDAVWEGIRVYEQGVYMLDEHLTRLHDSAHALLFENIPTRQFILNAIKQTLEANSMSSKAHMRLTLSRGEKYTSGMDPRINDAGCTLIVLAEWKEPVYSSSEGVNIITSSIRRNNPQFLDSKIHHANLLNNILAKIEANVANADGALMLDKDGFVAELNDTNVFMIKSGIIYTPYPTSCLPGITRQTVINIGKELGIEVKEKNLSLTDMYTADEVFSTGTMGELSPIACIDGRELKSRGKKMLSLIQQQFESEKNLHCTALNDLFG